MAVKPSTRVNVSVDVHAPPKNPVDGHLSDTPVRTGPGLTTTTRNPPRTDSPTGTADLDAILPAPAVTVSEQPLTVTPPTSPTAPLEQYTLSANAALPSADVEGFRTFKGRRYVDLNDGRVVQVAQDPDTGLYRARLPSELTPSGPTLIRDRDSRRWRSMNDNDAIAPLTGTRLQAFVTDLDFSTATADSDGVFHHDGKLYVVIDNRGYQVLQDLDASTPAQKSGVSPGPQIRSRPTVATSITPVELAKRWPLRAIRPTSGSLPTPDSTVACGVIHNRK